MSKVYPQEGKMQWFRSVLLGALTLVWISCNGEKAPTVELNGEEEAPTAALSGGGGACKTICTAKGEVPYCADTEIDANNCGGCGIVCPAGQSCVNSSCVCPTVTPNACGSGLNAFCTRFDADPNNCGDCGTVCPAGKMCSAQGCVETCAAGYTGCPVGAAEYCAKLSADVNNCGACEAACAPGQACVNGQCSCPSGQSLCATVDGTRCVPLQSDNTNCGTCGNSCGAGRTCQEGQCKCAEGLTDCAGTCTSLEQDTNNCGACGTVCPAGMVCTPNGCQETCATGTTACPATGTATYCASLQSDNLNCGSCGQACPPGKKCEQGQCTCTAGLIECGGTCTNPEQDINNCGGCGNVCPGGTVCTPSGCQMTCVSATPDQCATYCADFQTDKLNCGGCGNVCSGTSHCTNGKCCPAGKTNCNGTCLDLTNDHNNCGACGNVCPTGMGWYCVNGTCKQVCGASGTSCCFDPATLCGLGYPCQNANLCEGGLHCVNYGLNNTWCDDCGYLGGACCGDIYYPDVGKPCKQGLGCSYAGATGTCQQCGNFGQACCANYSGGGNCNSNTLNCDGPNGVGAVSGGSCQECGHADQACCSNSYCGGSLKCISSYCRAGALAPGEKLYPGDWLSVSIYSGVASGTHVFEVSTNGITYMKNGSGWGMGFGAYGGYDAFTVGYAEMDANGYFVIYDTDGTLRVEWGCGVAGSYFQLGVPKQYACGPYGSYVCWTSAPAVEKPDGTLCEYVEPGTETRY